MKIYRNMNFKNKTLRFIIFSILIVLVTTENLDTGSIIDTGENMIRITNLNNNKTFKILSGPSRPMYGNIQQQQQQSHIDQSSSGSGNTQNVQKHPAISDIDMQLLSAMEKLVGRMEKLDMRVKTLESIVYFLTNKEKPPVADQGNCPENFSKIDGIRGKCYYASSLVKSAKNIYDWKTAAGECGKMGGRLAEMLSYSDFHRISNFLTKYTDTRSTVATDFWTGGLNPGLRIWIWSESGQQIDLDKRFWNENDNGSDTPGCLKLSYSVRLNAFYYKGAPCSQTQNYICEVLDNTVARALAVFEAELNSESNENI